MQLAKQDIIQQLQKEVLSMQRLKKGSGQSLNTGLWEVEKAFPDHTFPLGAVHEFISNAKEDAAATNGLDLRTTRDSSCGGADRTPGHAFSRRGDRAGDRGLSGLRATRRRM